MSRSARRIYYSSAFAVFLVAGPLLVAWTGGYRWVNWRAGFVRTGALVISSDPRATVFLNGQPRGLTPQRLTHLRPGTYTVELKKNGWATWRRDVRIVPRTAQVIGPVSLVPPQFTSVKIDLGQAQDVIAADDRQTIFGVTKNANDWSVQAVWPDPWPTSTRLPWRPTAVSVSPNRQTVVYRDDRAAAIVNKNRGDAVWLTAAPDAITWDPSSANIVYGRRDGTLYRYDALTQGVTALGSADSFSLVGDSLWVTRTAAAATVITKQRTFGQSVPDVVIQLPDEWILADTGALTLNNPKTREMTELRSDPLTNQVTTSSFGLVDRMWWTDRAQPPLWLNGSDLLTFDDRQRTILVDRYPQPPTAAWWLVPGHILLTFDGQTLRIASVSDRQGRGTLLERRLAVPGQLLGFDLIKREAVFQTGTNPPQLSAWRW
ncbi:MAG: PEGA domain-containing protein [Patescibacteria group bacterium]